MRYRILLLLLLPFIMSCDEKENGPFKVSIVLKAPTEYGKADGSILLSIRGGLGPYRIEWKKDHPLSYSPIYNVEDLSGITSGMYYLRAEDQLGRIYRDTIFLATNDTVLALEYLPVYPGSYWIYSNGDTLRTLPDYKKTGVFLSLRPPPNYDQGHENVYFPNDSVYLPTWDGFPVLEYYEVNTSVYELALKPIIPEMVGETVFLTTDNRSFCTAIMTESIDTTITIGNNNFSEVIQTSRWSMYHGSCWDYPDKRNMVYHSKRYYAKNIGLIKEEIYQPNEPIMIRELVDWHINKDY